MREEDLDGIEVDAGEGWGRADSEGQGEAESVSVEVDGSRDIGNSKAGVVAFAIDFRWFGHKHSAPKDVAGARCFLLFPGDVCFI